MKTTPQLIESCQEKVKSLEEMIPVKSHQLRLDEIDSLVNSGNIWVNPQGGAALMKERQKTAELLEKLVYFQEQAAFYQDAQQSMPQELESMVPQIAQLEQEL